MTRGAHSSTPRPRAQHADSVSECLKQDSKRASNFVIPGLTRDPAVEGIDQRLISSGTPDQVRGDDDGGAAMW